MEAYQKRFGNTKNIPDSDHKSSFKSHSFQQDIGDKLFSQPDQEVEQFDFKSYINKDLKYPFSLNPKVAFPRDQEYYVQQNQGGKMQFYERNQDQSIHNSNYIQVKIPELPQLHEQFFECFDKEQWLDYGSSDQ